MTTVTITGTVSGYSLNSPVTTLIVTRTGYVTGGGITGGGAYAYTVLNSGRVHTYSNDGVYLADGGQVGNGGGADTTAVMSGKYTGVRIVGAGTVTNAGSILNQVYGHVVNGAVYFADGAGTLVNGSGVDDHALIEGGNGVMFRSATGSVANFGTILGDGIEDSNGVYLYDGGRLTNGSVTDRTALIEGPRGVYERFQSALTVANFGTILGTGYAAVRADYGGKVTNGAGGDTSALISGYDGVSEYKLATVANFGTIQGLGDYRHGVLLNAGGGVVNGTATDHAASIEGYTGVADYGAGYVSNFATISGIGGYDDFGVKVSGAALYNGRFTDTSAVIVGYGGAYLSGSAVSKNFGLIEGVGDARNGSGAMVGSGAELLNYGTLAGLYGAVVNDGGTLANFGTLTGSVGRSVYVAPAGTLIVEAGSTFDGPALSALGDIQFGDGVGTLSVDGGVAIASGSMAPTTFIGFGEVQIDEGASFALSGNPDIAGGYGLDILGAATADGTVIVNGSIGLAGTLAGTGLLSLAGGTAVFATGVDLAIAKVTQSAGSVAYFNTASVTVADVWTQTGGTIFAATGDKVTFTKVGDTFDGTLSGTCTIDFTAGTDALTGTRISAAVGISGTATVTLSGSVDLTSTMAVTSPDIIVAASGATLSGGGVVSLSNNATNAIEGASASATLTNSDTIKGAGQLGDGEMALTNAAAGVIQANQATALVINLGAGTLGNAGLIENTSTGGLTVSGAVANTGTLEVTAGTLAVDGAVSGAGSLKISGGTADFASTFAQNVTFTSTGGTLELADATSYTGEITGFAKTAVSSLDLLDISFVSGTTKATFSGTTASGVLTVTDGTHTAKITLKGNYTGSTFTVASDGHGGTTVTDPAKAAAGPPPLLPLAAAMAGFGAGGGAGERVTVEASRPALIALASPGIASS